MKYRESSYMRCNNDMANKRIWEKYAFNTGTGIWETYMLNILIFW